MKLWYYSIDIIDGWDSSHLSPSISAQISGLFRCSRCAVTVLLELLRPFGPSFLFYSGKLWAFGSGGEIENAFWPTIYFSFLLLDAFADRSFAAKKDNIEKSSVFELHLHCIFWATWQTRERKLTFLLTNAFSVRYENQCKISPQ